MNPGLIWVLLILLQPGLNIKNVYSADPLLPADPQPSVGSPPVGIPSVGSPPSIGLGNATPSDLITEVPAILADTPPEGVVPTFQGILDSINVDPNVIKAIVIEVLNSLSDTRVLLLAPMSAQYLSLADVPALSPYAIQSVLPSIVNETSIADINTALPEVLDELPSTIDASNVVVAILNALNPNNLQNVSPAILARLKTPGISTLNPSVVDVVVPALVSNLTPSNTTSIQDILNEVPSGSVSSLVALLLESLTGDERVLLSPLLAPYISSDSIASLSPDVLGVVIPALVNVNPPASLTKYVPELISSLPDTSNVFNLLLDILNITQANAPDATPSILPSAIPLAAPSFTEPDIYNSLPSAIANIAPSILNTVVSAILNALPSTYNLSLAAANLLDASTPDQTPSLAPTITPFVDAGQVPSLSPASIVELFPNFVNALSPADLITGVPVLLNGLPVDINIQTLVSSLLNDLYPNELNILAPSLTGLISPVNQLNLEPATIDRILPGYVPNLQPYLIGSVVPNLISALNTSANVSAVISDLLSTLGDTQIGALAPSILPNLAPAAIPAQTPQVVTSILPVYVNSILNGTGTGTPDQLANIIPSALNSLPPGALQPVIAELLNSVNATESSIVGPIVAPSLIASTYPALSVAGINTTLPSIINNTTVDFLQGTIPTILSGIANSADASNLAQNILRSLNTTADSIAAPSITPFLNINSIPALPPDILGLVIPAYLNTLPPGTAQPSIEELLDTLSAADVLNLAAGILNSLDGADLAATTPVLAPLFNTTNIPLLSPRSLLSVIPEIAENTAPATIATVIPDLIGTLSLTKAATDIANIVDELLRSPGLDPTKTLLLLPSLEQYVNGSIPNYVPSIFVPAPPVQVPALPPVLTPIVVPALPPVLTPIPIPALPPVLTPIVVPALPPVLTPILIPALPPVLTPIVVPALPPVTATVPTINPGLPPSLPPSCQIISPYPSPPALVPISIPSTSPPYNPLGLPPQLPSSCRVIQPIPSQVPVAAPQTTSIPPAVSSPAANGVQCILGQYGNLLTTSTVFSMSDRYACEHSEFMSNDDTFECSHGVWTTPSSLVVDPKSTTSNIVIDGQTHIKGDLVVNRGSQVTISDRVTVDGAIHVEEGATLLFEYQSMADFNIVADQVHLSASSLNLGGNVHLVITQAQLKGIYKNGGRVDIELMTSLGGYDEGQYTRYVGLNTIGIPDSCFEHHTYTKTTDQNPGRKMMVTILVSRSADCEQHMGVVLPKGTWVLVIAAAATSAVMGILGILLALFYSSMGKNVRRCTGTKNGREDKYALIASDEAFVQLGA